MANHLSADSQAATACGPTLVAPGAKKAAAPRTRGVRARTGAQVEDELAAHRRRRAQQRATVARWVDRRIDALECQEAYTVSRLFVLVAGSLAPGHLLSLAAQWSDHAFAESGSAWVHRPVQDWINHSGLMEHDWIEAREILREQGLIQERRRFDMTANEIVVEIAFVHEAFAQRVAALREEVRAEAWERLRAGQAL